LLAFPKIARTRRPRRVPGGLVLRSHAGLARLAVASALAGLALDAAAGTRVAAVDLSDLSLEQLGNVIVSSVSRRLQPVAAAPASVFVIQRDDIRRSGATSLPEALRLAPNLQVARADVNQYAVTARGSNSVLANKLLVMVDGRTVYSPIFSGVFWEAVDVVLDDIERIEVISGPGATLWGINAMNGVINIITRDARATNGTLAEAGAGNRERGAAVRVGGSAGEGSGWRVYGKAFERDHGTLRSGRPIRDSSDRGQIGFRYDSTVKKRWLTVQGDAYRARIDQVPAARELSGANLLARWSGELSEDSDLTVQTYYDRTERFHPATFRQDLDTFDVSLLYATMPAADHRLLLGAGYRHARDKTEAPGPGLAFIPLAKTLAWGHAFAQDDIALGRNLQLTIGAKVETNVYTGAEFLPNIRLAWQAEGQRLLWGALSRAVRAPARIDRDLYQPAELPHFTLAGGPDFVSETADVVELGYREQFGDAMFWSATLFHNDFNRLRSIEQRAAGPRVENQLDGRVYGIEAWGEWRVTAAWRLGAGAVRQRVEFSRQPGSSDVAGLASLSFDPAGWWSLRSTLDVLPGVEFDVAVRRVGALQLARIPGYTAVDARFGWRPLPALELSLTLQNAADSRHPEWGPMLDPSEHPRTAFVRAIWRQ
jgi:iron complex outermembrane recepter protein